MDKPLIKVRVLLVAPSLGILGGQAVQAKRLFDALQESKRIQVSFLAVNPALPGLFGSLQKIKYVRTIITTVAYVWSLLRAIPKHDVVHAFSASYTSYLLAPLPAIIVAKIFRKATLLNYHSGEADDHLTRWRMTAAPSMRAFADAIVTPSEYLVQVFQRHGLPAQAIANFIELELWPYRRRTQIQPRFLSNRNLEALYNVGCSIRAFAIVKTRFPAATLTVAGAGTQRDELETFVHSEGLAGIEFVGRIQQSDMGALYNGADVYLNSPNIDNMPLSIVEAFACGVPVVSTNAGGIPFVVAHGVNGLLVNVDDHEAMAEAAIHLLEHPSRVLDLTDAARQQCEIRYVWSAVSKAWETIYAALGNRSSLRHS